MATKRIVIVSALAAFATALTACSGTPAAPTTSPSPAETSATQAPGQEKPAEITLYSIMTKGTPMGDILSKVITRFEAETGIKVVVSEATGDAVFDAYEAAVAAGTEADLVNLNPQGKVHSWVANGAVVDAAPYLEQWGLTETIVPEAFADWKGDDDVVFGIPMIGNIWPMVWNTDSLTKLGLSAPPANEAELVGTVEKAKAAKIAPIAAGGADWSGAKFAQLVWQAYSTAEEATDVYLNGGYCASEPTMKGIEYFVRLRDAGVFQKNAEGYSYDQMNTAYFTGAAAGMHAGNWVFEDVPAELKEVTVPAGMPVPADSPNKPLYYANYASGGWLISPNGVAKSDWIGQFVKMWYTQEIADEMAQNAAAVLAFDPPTAPTYTNPILTKAMDVRANAQHAPLMDTLVPGDFQADFNTASSAAFAPGKTAADICKSLDAAYK